jgi:predicted nucleic acid-binding Zn ribbon protein
MLYCIVCGEVTNLNFSLCSKCLDKQMEENRKKYNWPFESKQFIRFGN